MRLPFIDYDTESPEVKADPGQWYQRTILEFSNIQDFVSEYYNDNTIIVPLLGGASIDVIKAEKISNLPDENMEVNSFEEYRKIYDPRLINPYILRSGKLNIMNVKMLGGRKDGERGLITTFCDIMEWSDRFISNLPFGFAEKVVKAAQNKYDQKFSNGHGGYLKSVVWIPLWCICGTHAIVVTLFNRVDIIFT